MPVSDTSVDVTVTLKMKFTIYPVNMLDPIQKCSGYSPLKNKSKVWVIFDMISVKVR